tara:strand:- start:101 stop:580 length:480 start_codon:yes stop_codon:yes gene_type:complete
MKSLLTFLLCLFFSFVSGQSKLKDASESWAVEMSANVSYYNSLSISVEKTFTEGRWLFGPRVELINLFTPVNYIAEDDSTYQMVAQLRVRLAQIEYQINPHLRVGIAPVWMLGPLPKKGFYKTPSSIYAHIQLKEGLSLETTYTIANVDAFQISLRKKL